MEEAKRARKAETPKQPSLRLRLRAPYLYPNRYLIRDRDGAYGEIFLRRVRSIGIRDRPTSHRSPWQIACAERLIGSIRRVCTDHIVIFGEGHLRHVLLSYMGYHNGTRTHLSLNKDAPISRAAENAGRIICRPILGGLHHQFGRMRFTVGTAICRASNYAAACSAPDRRLATFVFGGQLGRHGLERAKARTITAIGRNRRIAHAGPETARR
jgi:hypothetical protein